MNNYEKYVANIRQQKSKQIFKLVTKKKGTWINQTDDVHAHFRCELSCKKNHVFYCLPITLKRGGWCPICSKKGYKGEEVTREILQKLLGVKFPKTRRIEGLVSDKGNQLEIDGFNEELKIGFEYQGRHHYETRDGGLDKEEILLRVQINDNLKKDFFERKGWILLVIKQNNRTIDSRIKDIKNIMRENNIEFKDKAIVVSSGTVSFTNVYVKKIALSKGRVKYEHKKMNLEKAIKYAKKFKTRKDFLKSKEGKKIYSWVNYHKKQKEVMKHLSREEKSIKYMLNLKEVSKLAKNYPTRGVFKLKNTTLYKYAKKKGYLNKIFTKKQKTRKGQPRWTKESVVKICKGLKTRYELHVYYPGAYKYALKHGFLDELLPNKKKV